MKWDDFKEYLKEQSVEDRERFEFQEAVFTLIVELTEMRRKRNMSQRELAEKTGLKQSVIARMENLATNPQLKTLVKIANVLDVKFSIVDNKKDDYREKRRQECKLVCDYDANYINEFNKRRYNSEVTKWTKTPVLS